MISAIGVLNTLNCKLDSVLLVGCSPISISVFVTLRVKASVAMFALPAKYKIFIPG